MKTLVALLIICSSFSALRAEEARLYLEPLESIAEMGLGDTLEVGVYIDAGNLALTSASIYLSYDPAIFDLVPALVSVDGRPLPFASADFMAATVYENAVAAGKNTPLSYIAVSGVGIAGERAVGSGRGLLASVRLRTVGYPAQGVAKVWLEAAGQHQPSYTIRGEPGVEQRFYAPAKPLYQQVKAEGLLGLPDVHLEEGETVAIDLAAHFLSAVWSATDLRWQAKFRDAGAGAIAVDGTTLRLTPAADGIVDYAVEGPDGVRWSGEFAVRVAQKERYLQGGTMYTVEDGGLLRRALGEYLIAPERMGEWSVRGGERVAATIVEDQLEVMVPADWAGEDVLELRFCVGVGDCETLAIPVVVDAQNDAPTALAPPARELVVGQRLTWPLESIFADVDNALDELVVSLQSSGIVELYVEGGALVVEALEVGEERVLLHVEDPQGQAAEVAWTLRVSAPSVGPRFLAQPALVLIIDTAYRIDLSRYVEDEDTPFEELVWALRGDGVELSWADDEPFVLLARGLVLGATTAYLSVRDPEGSEAVAAWAVEVVASATDSVGIEGKPIGRVEVVADTTSNEPGAGNNGGEPTPTEPTPTEEANWSIAPLGSVSLRVGELHSVSLQDHLIGRRVDAVRWSVDGAAGIVVELANGTANLRAVDSFSGRSVVLFYAVDDAGQRRSAVLEVEVEGGQQGMVLGDIPDVEMTAGTTLHIELTNYADRPVSWSVSGGDEIEIRIVEDVAILRAAGNFHGRSVVLFRAVDSEGNSAVDVVRVEVSADATPVAATGDTTATAAGDSSATSGGNGGSDRSPPVPETGANDILQLGVWPDYVVELGTVGSTPVLDELVVSGDAAAVQWSLRGGAFVSGAIDVARRVVLDASAARIGREVFMLTAQLGSVQREVVLGVEVRAPVFELLEPPAAVQADENGYELAQLVGGSALGIEWQVSSVQAVIRLEAGRLFVDAQPGSYEVLVTGRSASGVERQVALRIDVLGEQEGAVEPGGIAPETLGFSPQFAMPTQLELEAGASGRWPLVVLDEDSAREELLLSLVANGGQARIEGAELVLQAGTENFSVDLHVRDPLGNEGGVHIEVLVRAVDNTPPEIELAGDLASAGQVLWTLRADEELGEVLLLVDGQPLPVRHREGAAATWLQMPTGRQQVVRVVASDRSGNTVQKEIAMSAGPIGDGFALESADGRLRALGGASATPALLYAEGEDYRLDFVPGERVEIALFSEGDSPGLLYGDGATWREVGAALSADTQLLRAVISEPGWLRAVGGQDQVVAAAVYPNPFNATTAIRLYMPSAGFLRAVVYDALGRRVRVLAQREHGAGAWTLRWHGRDERGNEAASGVYFVEIVGPGWRQRARMLLLR